VTYPSTGEILQEEFLKPMGINAYCLAKDIDVQQRRISEIVTGIRSRCFGTSDEFWTGLQLDFDTAKEEDPATSVWRLRWMRGPPCRLGLRCRRLDGIGKLDRQFAQGREFLETSLSSANKFRFTSPAHCGIPVVKKAKAAVQPLFEIVHLTPPNAPI
jgi:antitoxin HigA-1